MNDVNARAVPTMGGYEGQFRKVHKAEWEPVRVNGIAQLYPTADAAEVAASRALRSHLCGTIVGDGPKSVLATAAQQFNAIFKRGRKIPVERKNGR